MGFVVGPRVGGLCTHLPVARRIAENVGKLGGVCAVQLRKQAVERVVVESVRVYRHAVGGERVGRELCTARDERVASLGRVGPPALLRLVHPTVLIQHGRQTRLSPEGR